jgi:hypothetical protein
MQNSVLKLDRRKKGVTPGARNIREFLERECQAMGPETRGHVRAAGKEIVAHRVKR